VLQTAAKLSKTGGVDGAMFGQEREVRKKKTKNLRRGNLQKKGADREKVEGKGKVQTWQGRIQGEKGHVGAKKKKKLTGTH